MRNFKKLTIAGIAILVISSAALVRDGLPFTPMVALAQANTCPDIVKTALAATNKQCTRTARNKACYGNSSLTAEPQAGITDLKFTTPGDIADVNTIRTLRLTAMDTTAKTWGVAMMRIQADLPDTSPTDNVTLLLFGDVEITDASQVATAVRPTQIADLLTAQASITPSDTPISQATLAKTLQPMVTLNPTTTPALATPYTYKPMQAFYFKSGTANSPCTAAPQDGILIQSPQGKQKVELSIDGVRVNLGSTVFVTAQPSKEMILETLQGTALVEAGGVQVTVPAGTSTGVEVDASLQAAGVPSLAEAYGMPDVRALPVNNLPGFITIAQPLVPSLGKGNPVCPVIAGTPTNITFINNRDRAVSIYWLSYQCKEVLYKTLQPGESYVQATFVTHSWFIRDAENQTLLKQLVADGTLASVVVP